MLMSYRLLDKDNKRRSHLTTVRLFKMLLSSSLVGWLYSSFRSLLVTVLYLVGDIVDVLETK